MVPGTPPATHPHPLALHSGKISITGSVYSLVASASGSGIKPSTCTLVLLLLEESPVRLQDAELNVELYVFAYHIVSACVLHQVN